MTALTCLDPADFICSLFFFFNDTATTEIYTLSLHDALPILGNADVANGTPPRTRSASRSSASCSSERRPPTQDRKSTRLNSSHSQISYAVFCLKKKKTNNQHKHRLVTVARSLPRRLIAQTTR